MKNPEDDSYIKSIIYEVRPASDYADRNYPAIKVGSHTFYVAANIWTKERFAKFLESAKELAGNDPRLMIM